MPAPSPRAEPVTQLEQVYAIATLLLMGAIYTYAIGAVCGWDGTPQEAYCVLDRGGTKVCARWSAGGRCPRGPPTAASTP